jgi:hypothetical protein
MGLNWNEIKSRALLFSKTWADACNEDSEAKPFWIDFFEIFGITNKRVATFELNVKKLGGAQGFVDLFWPGVLLVEHKSRGKNLDNAVDQAYQPNGGKKSYASDAERVAFLFELYQRITSLLPAPADKKHAKLEERKLMNMTEITRCRNPRHLSVCSFLSE